MAEQPDTQNGSGASAVVQDKEQAPKTQPPPEPQTPPQKLWQRIPKPVRIVGAIALIAGIGFGVYRLFFYKPEPNGLFLCGRIEGEASRLISEFIRMRWCNLA